MFSKYVWLIAPRSIRVNTGPPPSPPMITQVQPGLFRKTQVHPSQPRSNKLTQNHPGPPRTLRFIQVYPGFPSTYEWEGVLVMLQWFTYLKECIGRATAICTIFDLGLFGQILSWVDRRIHLGCSQESSQVGSVRWDHNKCKEPPHSSNHSCWYSPKNGDMILETCRKWYVQFRF